MDKENSVSLRDLWIRARINPLNLAEFRNIIHHLRRPGKKNEWPINSISEYIKSELSNIDDNLGSVMNVFNIFDVYYLHHKSIKNEK
jgi:hypothetical protein